jgi:hypothetical protein
MYKYHRATQVLLEAQLIPILIRPSAISSQSGKSSSSSKEVPGHGKSSILMGIQLATFD